MIRRLPALFRTTTFRLALIHAGMFAAFSAGLLIYLYSSTVGYLGRQTDRDLRSEVETLAAAYRNGGLNRLNQSVIERVSVPGNFYYMLVDASGTRISGDFAAMPVDPPDEGQDSVEFDYQIQREDGSVFDRTAKGVVIRLPDQLGLMVAYDTEEQGEIVGRITSAVWTAAPIGLLLSLLGGLIVSRSAARRAEGLSETAEAVMQGDLTRRAPLLGSGDEFDELSERLNAMLDRIERLMMATRYAGDAIAHDLRSPLTRLRNRLESQLADPDQLASPEDALGQTIEEVDAVLATFNSIMRLSRVEAGTGMQFEEVDLSELCEEMAELFEPAAEDAGIGFDSEIEAGITTHADRSLMAQVLSNLLDNAIKYTPEGGALTMRLRRNHIGETEISVTDTGPGIPSEQYERVTERFVRLESSRQKGGSGLGLSLVAAVAEIHSARLELSDGPGPEDAPGLRAALVMPKPSRSKNT